MKDLSFCLHKYIAIPLGMYRYLQVESCDTSSITMGSQHDTRTGLVLLPDLLCFLRLRVSSSNPESASAEGLELAAGSDSCAFHTAF